MKKDLSLVIAILFLLSILAACTSNPPAQTTKDSTSPTTPSTPTKSSEPVEIVFLANNSWSKEAEEVARSFEKDNPNIKIKIEAQPFKQLFETIEVQMSSKKPNFDMFAVDAPLVANYSLKGYLEPLDGTIDASMKQKWVEASLNAGSYGGKIMAAPLNTSSQVLYYNKDILAERGVTPPSSDVNQRWTWDQLVEAAKKLTYDKNGDGQTDVYGFTFDQIGRPYQLLPLGQGLGGKPISDNGLISTGYTNSPEMIQGAKFYFDLFNTWKVSPKISPDLTKEYFMTGKVAMILSTTGTLNSIKDKVNLGYAPHPSYPGKKAVTPTGSWHVGISKYSAKKEAAAKFIQYFTVGKGAQQWFDIYRQVPANKDILDSIDKDPKYGEFPLSVLRIATYEARSTAVPRPLSPGYLEWEALYTQAYEDIKNGTDPKKALDDAVIQIDRQLKKYESAVK